MMIPSRRTILRWTAAGFGLASVPGPVVAQPVPAPVPLATPQPRGRALVIGLNSVDPKHYSGWEGKLSACEFDAEDITKVARDGGFNTEQLLTAQATRAAVLENLHAAAAELGAGDLFFLFFAGCGGKLPDINNEDESDGEDETWCLFDAQLADDELTAALARFRPGVRIIQVVDSCNLNIFIERANFDQIYGRHTPNEFRVMPAGFPRRVYRDNRELYDKILESTRTGDRDELSASVLCLSACQNNQLALDGGRNGLFTAFLLYVWDEGRFRGDYHDLHDEVVVRMPPTQSPRLKMLGPPDPEFERGRPFTIIPSPRADQI